jgi:polyphosphate kinase 2 (PPK2 family)
MVERIENLVPEAEWRRAYRDIVDFEHALASDSYLILKFFMHISREEQRHRFENLTKDPLNAWRVLPEDWEHHAMTIGCWFTKKPSAHRDRWAPWTIVEATDRRYTQMKIYKTIIAALEERLAALNALPDRSAWELPYDEEPEAEEGQLLPAQANESMTAATPDSEEG